ACLFVISKIMHFILMSIKYLLELFKNRLCIIEADKQGTHHLSGKNITKEFTGKNNFNKTSAL
ncbi:MAG: hypothetical protein WCE96_00335, partial [Nitrososphaeraceae archaeon]